MDDTDGGWITLKVLVVDDDPEAAQSLAELVGIHGHEARIAHDGRSALRHLRDDDFHLVLLDIGLPDMDGYAVARRLTLLGRRGISIVAVTGYASDEAMRRSVGAGLDDHIVKPCGSEQLTQILLKAMARIRHGAAGRSGGLAVQIGPAGRSGGPAVGLAQRTGAAHLLSSLAQRAGAADLP